MSYNFLIIFVIVNQVICDADRRIITTLKYSKFYVKPTIVNGEEATVGQVPYIVSIKVCVYYEHICETYSYKMFAITLYDKIIHKLYDVFDVSSGPFF